MDRLILEIRAALQANMFTLALQGALALIDICAALESSDDRTRANLFKAWYTTHLGSSFSELSDEDAYQLRCGLLHQGRASSDQYEAVVFAIPPVDGIYFHAQINGALLQGLTEFVTGILDRVEAWWTANQNNEPIKTNAEFVVRLRPEGLEPYVAGVPVLA